METHLVETRFGLVEVRVYRLKEGWWPVLMRGRQLLPDEPVVGAPMAGSVREAVAQMAVAVNRLEGGVVVDRDEAGAPSTGPASI
jgi:hypothetical protein